MACACAQGKQLWKFWEMGTLTQCWPWLSLSPSFLPQAGAERETPASHRIKSEYSQFLPFLLHCHELCPISPLLSEPSLPPFPTGKPLIIPGFFAGVIPAPVLGKLFTAETPDSSNEEQEDSYFSI